MRLLRLLIPTFVLAMVFLSVAAGAIETPKRTPTSKEQIQLSFAPLVKKTAPAVVNIFSRKVIHTRQFSPLFNDPFFRQFFGDNFGPGRNNERDRVQNSLGSGVIIQDNGVVITNHHVIKGADQITVILADRREFDAVIIGTDERTDLAVLRIELKGEKLPFMKMSDSDELEVGDLVLAIGNPFGVGQTVTSGIVSALARTRTNVSDLNSFIQTDAAINPGNSGGALVDMNGNLVGVNSAIYSKSGGSLGIGFAIPSNMVRTVVTGVLAEGRLVRPWLGAWGQGVNSDIAASLSLPRPIGVLINKVFPGGPADKADVRVGEVVLEVQGHEIADPEALDYRLATLQVGGETTLTLWRRKGKAVVTLKLEAPPEIPPRKITGLSGPHPLSGATVGNMSPALADEMGVKGVELGVIILRLKRGSAAMRLRFRVGDFIKSINGKPVKTVAHLINIMSKRFNRWSIALKRNGKTINMVINR